MLTLAGKPLAVPVLQGGMGVGVSLGGLAGAVAACGGMGCISTADTGYREPDFARDPCAANLRALKKEIAKAKEIAGGAGLVAINAMVATQNYADAVRTAVEAGVDAIVSGAGLPLELPGLVEKADVALAPIVDGFGDDDTRYAAFAVRCDVRRNGRLYHGRIIGGQSVDYFCFTCYL